MKQKLSEKTRLALAFVILCAMTVGILFTGPGFSFTLQVILASVALFLLFWLIT
ncbi:hypothetical protein [Nitrospina watsonii]|uniref:Uncharacterized protein n=1 Tax=Nitrospina watsonii TaxID=1323948 RepID=A0ABM9HFJ7_9BACT|nr:hypothetical protein [Nitrospina watsonii]CAI2718774.1 conserved protein of unknown function [Nitrospina watsonii]